MTASTESLPLLLLKARETSLARIRPILQDHGLTEPQWRVLQTLYDHPSLSAQRLADASCILSPSLSRILTRFSSEGLVLRSVSSADQRSVTIRLSAKGRRLCGRLMPKVRAQYRKLQDETGSKRVDQLAEMLQTFIGEG